MEIHAICDCDPIASCPGGLIAHDNYCYLSDRLCSHRGGFSELNNVSKNGGGASAYLTPQNQVGYIINPYFTVYASQPTATGNGWQVNGQVSILAPANVTVYAICASLD
jgi:hypothetical protein